MTAVLRDVRGDRGHLGDLMPSRCADAMPRAQPVCAVTTRLRHEIDDGIHAFDGHQLTVVSRMSRLTAHMASTLHATPPLTLTTCQAIG